MDFLWVKSVFHLQNTNGGSCHARHRTPTPYSAKVLILLVECLLPFNKSNIVIGIFVALSLLLQKMCCCLFMYGPKNSTDSGEP
jgi:hypothetical protein